MDETRQLEGVRCHCPESPWPHYHLEALRRYYAVMDERVRHDLATDLFHDDFEAAKGRLLQDIFGDN